MNAEMYVSAEKFKGLSSDDKIDLIYETLVHRCAVCNERICALESHKRKDRALSATSGFLGGFVAFFSAKFFGV